MESKVYAIILSYNNHEAVRRCLRSVLASKHGNLVVLLVDNASTDNTPSLVHNEFPGCKVLVNLRNLGYSRGCNVGIEAAVKEGAEFILLLNQDTVVSPDMTDKLVDFMVSHPKAGIVGPKTLSHEPMPDGSPRLLYAGAWRGLLPLRQKVPGIERTDSGRAGQPVPVDYVWGHGMMLRAEALNKSGLFDQDFFMYYEDMDLCLRMSQAGYQVFCEPSAVMWHESVDGARAKVSEYWRWVFLGKHYGPITSRLLVGLTVFAEAQQLLRHGRFKALRHLLNAHFKDMMGW